MHTACVLALSERQIIITTLHPKFVFIHSTLPVWQRLCTRNRRLPDNKAGATPFPSTVTLSLVAHEVYRHHFHTKSMFANGICFQILSAFNHTPFSLQFISLFRLIPYFCLFLQISFFLGLETIDNNTHGQTTSTASIAGQASCKLNDYMSS